MPQNKEESKQSHKQNQMHPKIEKAETASAIKKFHSEKALKHFDHIRMVKQIIPLNAPVGLPRERYSTNIINSKKSHQIPTVAGSSSIPKKRIINLKAEAQENKP